MSGLNRVTLLGNLGAEPEVKFTNGGQAILKMRLATTETYFNKAREKQERTEWHSVVLWGARAEALGKLLRKGERVLVEGRIEYRQYETKSGEKRTSAEINATNVVLLGGRGDRREAAADTDDLAERLANGRDDARSAGQDYGGGNVEDDIPFARREDW